MKSRINNCTGKADCKKIESEELIPSFLFRYAKMSDENDKNCSKRSRNHRRRSSSTEDDTRRIRSDRERGRARQSNYRD